MTVGRVIVAVGGAASPLAAAAARLAARLEAELLGLFVEEESWHRMAALPFTRVAGHGPLSQAIDTDVLARALRRGVAEMRRALAEAAGPELRWTLRVVRGFVVAEAVREAGAGDLVIVPAESLTGGVLEAAAHGRAYVLALRGGGEARRILVPAGAGPDVAAGVARLAAACGWRVETTWAPVVEYRGHAADVVVAVRAGEVPPALRPGTCSLLLVRVASEAEGVRGRGARS